MKRRLSAKPHLRRKLAESSPNAVLRWGSFWIAQIDYWIVVLGSLVVFVLLAPYTYLFAQGWVFLTVVVQLLAVYGAVITIKAMAKIEVETAIVGEVEFRGAEYLRSLKARQSSRIDLQQLEEDILPNNQASPPLAMIRLFQHICKEARDRRFESSINVIQPFREEALEDIFRLQNIQKIALWLGILGTFIGLLRAIQVGDLGNIREENFVNLIAGMFQNLFISFSASLAGLEVAVILGAFLLLLRKRHETYFQSMESAVVTMLSLARNAINKDDFFVEFGQIRQSMNLLRDQLYHQTEELAAGMNTLGSGVTLQTEEIKTGITRLSETGVKFDDFLKRVTERHQQLIDDVKSVYDAISLRNLGSTLHQSVGQVGQQLSDALNPNVSRLSAEIAGFNETLHKLNAIVQEQTRHASESMAELAKQIRTQGEEQSNVSLAIERKLQSFNHNLDNGNSSRLGRDLNELAGNLAALNSSLTRNYQIKPVRKGRLRTMLTSLRRRRARTTL
jgi:hypothetical protein